MRKILLISVLMMTVIGGLISCDDSPTSSGSDTAGKIIDINSTSPDSTYSGGDTVNVTISFNKAVTLAGGNLAVALNTGDTVWVTSFSDTTDVSAEYIVTECASSTDLDVSSIALTGTATLKDSENDDVSLVTPDGSNLADNKDIIINAVKIISITSTSPDSTYKGDDTINISVVFSEPVVLTNDSLIVQLETGDVDFDVKLGDVVNDSIITGNYVVDLCHSSSDLNANSVTLQGTATLLSANGNSVCLTLPSGANLADNKDIALSTIKEITDNITSPTVWKGDNVYVIKAYDFYVENTLTIEPGAVVKFLEGYYMMIGTGGSVQAVGTEDDPIVFTSYKDDEHGCDNNGDGNATSPAPKDWGEINTNGTNGSRFEYCEFYYGGSSTYNASLTLYGDNHKVDHCLFVNNDGSYTVASGDVGVLNANDAESQTVITNNVFYNNDRPLSISTAFSLDSSNVFHNPDNPTETNTYNGIFVESLNEITSNIIWGETEVAYVIDDNDFWVDVGATLQVEDNVVLKFKDTESTILFSDGISAFVNHDGTGVVFTSYRDDTHKGDTNGDGTATSPADGDWNGIYDDNTSTYMSWSNIYYDNH